MAAGARRHQRRPDPGCRERRGRRGRRPRLLERLPARERAAYVLREAFDYDYPAIATILETTETNARQYVSRAKKHLASERHVPVDDGRSRLLEAFLEAARSGDLAGLERVLAEDVVSVSDGAGMVARAARRPVVGRDKVARFVAGFAGFFWTDTTLTWLITNGAPSVLVSRTARPSLSSASTPPPTASSSCAG